jgi:hypothetical protein
MAGYHDIIAYKGSAFRYHFKLLDESGNGVNLASSTAKMQVRRSPLDEDVLLDFGLNGVTLNYFGSTGSTLSNFSATGGIDLNFSYLGVSGETGGMYVYAPSSVMDAAPVGNWMYSLALTISGDDENLVQGRFAIDWNAAP